MWCVTCRIPAVARRCFCWALVVLCPWWAAIAGRAAVDPKSVVSGPAEPLVSAQFHNLHRITPRIYCGSAPESEAAFAELAALGVKVVISVDGVRPDVALARRHGLRYVHLPVGYDGIPTNRVVELTKAATTAGGPVYVHCHHGRHRGPAAAAIICAATEAWTTDRTRALLEQMGTGREYVGLYRSLSHFHPPEPQELQAVGPLPEVARPSSLAQVMVAIDGSYARLKAAAASGFRETPGHSDAAPAAEAVLIWEQFREVARLPAVGRQQGSEYRGSLAAAERLALELRDALADREAAAEVRQRTFEALGRRCVGCHRSCRD